MVLALVEPIGLGVEARTVERLRAVVRERQQESPLVLGEGALARKADDEHAERAVGDPERETGDRHGFVTELLREPREELPALGQRPDQHGRGGAGRRGGGNRRVETEPPQDLEGRGRVAVFGEQLHLAALLVDQSDRRGGGSVLLDRLAHDGRGHIQRRQRARQAHAQGVQARGVARSLLRPLARPRLGLREQRALERLAAQLRHRREELGVGRADLVRVVEEQVERARGLAVDDQWERIDGLRAITERACARREERHELRRRCALRPDDPFGRPR